MPKIIVQVVVDAPLFQMFDYVWDEVRLEGPPELGRLVEIEFGKKHAVGVVIGILGEQKLKAEKEKWDLKEVLQKAPIKLNKDSLNLAKFASDYYVKPLGEVILSSVPIQWKKPEKWLKLVSKIEKNLEKIKLELKNDATQFVQNEQQFELSQEQEAAVKELKQATDQKNYKSFLLQGITGSGKTAVYLEWIKYVLKQAGAQCLLLVPEINLTPQLVEELKIKFPSKKIAVLHSEVTDSNRSQAWYLSHIGQADLIVGTRLSVMASIPNLKAIVVDEENDPSYKQQEGIRYSARDLAIWRANDKKIPILLVSATPSCETWEKVQSKKIDLLELTKRAKEGAQIPEIHLIDLKYEKQHQRLDQNGISKSVKEAIEKTLERKLQTLLFINRRGFAPILRCHACGWKSGCPKCSAYLVLHKKNTIQHKNMMHCHHCGLVAWPPKHCPDCGNQDLGTLGSGTQQIEDAITTNYPNAKILRVDTDATRKKGSATELFAKIHEKDVDIIVGTQMLAKGHDFDYVETVVVLDADKSLYSQDFRSTERLFSQLIQVAGRGGRSDQSIHPRILIQTEMPEHPLYQALIKKNIKEYLNALLEERKMAELPPYSSQALIIADGKSSREILSALQELREDLQSLSGWPREVEIYDAVPRSMAKVAGRARAQILLETKSRPQLQIALNLANELLEQKRKKSRSIRFVIERDPSSY